MAGYLILILGIALWSLPHLFKRVMPARRAEMGDAGKGVVAISVLAGIVLMVIGYRMADPVFHWPAPGVLTHVNNLLMLIGLYLFAVAGLQTRLARRIRHPQLSGVKAWAVAHLLVVGTLPGLVLFGGLLAWAVVSVVLINRAERRWSPPAPAPLWKEGAAVIAALVLMAVIGWIHGWLGPWPFG